MAPAHAQLDDPASGGAGGGQAARLMVLGQFQLGKDGGSYRDCRISCRHLPARTNRGHKRTAVRLTYKDSRNLGIQSKLGVEVENGGSDWGKARPAAQVLGTKST